MDSSYLWLLFLLPYFIMTNICFYWIVIKKIGREKRCTAKVEGLVKRMSSVHYGDSHTAVVEYFVNNKKYKVIGPKFLGGSRLSVKTPFQNPESSYETNLTSKDNLPLYVHVKVYKNSTVSITRSPILDLFPIGSKVDVYYNPDKPKEAYVHRFEGISKLMTGVFVGANVLFISLSVLFLVI